MNAEHNTWDLEDCVGEKESFSVLTGVLEDHGEEDNSSGYCYASSDRIEKIEFVEEWGPDQAS